MSLARQTAANTISSLKELVNAGFVVSVKAYNASNNRVRPKEVAKAMSTSTVSYRAVIAELIATFFFVYSGTATAVFFSYDPQNSLIASSFGIVTALAFGTTIMVSVFGKYSVDV